MTYQVRIPDIEYFQQTIECMWACPARTDARGYIMAIAHDEIEAGYAIARGPNPMSSTCGRICNAPCEIACRRGSIDKPVSIRGLKRVTTERYGPEAQMHLPAAREDYASSGNLGHSGNQTVRDRVTLQELAALPDRQQGRVAVIGSGPAGVTVAHNLSLLGHEVTLFEADMEVGGMIRQGVPLYRLDRDLLRNEIQETIDLGVELRLGTRVGEGDNPTLSDLRNEYDAVYIGVGLGQGRNLNIPGAQADGVMNAIDFLINANQGYRLDMGERVIIIGGGNVAIDAARTALRFAETGTLEKQDDAAIYAALDAARTAARLGVTDVRMIALEDWNELPAYEIEIEEALEEGIQILPRLGPQRIVEQDGKVTGLETIEVASVFDADGRFNPSFIDNTEAVMECDTVILAIGQSADLSLLESVEDVEVSRRGLIVADEYGRTGAPDVFAGGDIVRGPRLLIEAVGDGAEAAISIDTYIQGREPIVVKTAHFEDVGHQTPNEDILRPRQDVPVLPVDRRVGIAEVETGYTVEEAEKQAKRCVECSVNTVFDSDLCILCGGCIDVCPWDCLKIVRLSDMDGGTELGELIKTRYGDNPDGAAIIKDEEKCTRCALCAIRCPTDAITMEAFTFKEEFTYGD